MGTVERGFFLTGMQRSGTTLLEKLLDAHSQISVLSQPAPFLFLELKRDFLSRLGFNDEPYPLGTLFRERRYQVGDFERFLADARVGPDYVNRVFSAMEAFSGQYTRIDRRRRDAILRRLPRAEPSAIIDRLYRDLSHKPGARWFGAKETVCEEFLPYLLARGFRGAIIVRDVRDVLTSLNHGRGGEFGGSPKPTLFNIRGWRRSVAYALHLAAHPAFGWVRYEDLVANPAGTLQRLTAAMGLPNFGPGMLERILQGEIRDQGGTFWSGNSSHGAQEGISRASVGAYRERLPESVTRFATAACFPELVRLGYRVPIDRAEVPSLLRSFQDPYPINRPGLANYLTDRSEIEAEVERFGAFVDGKDASSWFLLPGVGRALAGKPADLEGA